jgi:hypothetical protein
VVAVQDVNAQHLFFLLSGLLVGYWVVGPGVGHSITTILVTYIILLVGNQIIVDFLTFPLVLGHCRSEFCNLGTVLFTVFLSFGVFLRDPYPCELAELLSLVPCSFGIFLLSLLVFHDYSFLILVLASLPLFVLVRSQDLFLLCANVSNCLIVLSP